MPSNNRSEAARANGAQSKGPKTAEGKQRSSQNALRHGIFASAVTLRNEDPEAYDQLLREYTGEHNPVGPTECDLIEEIVYCKLRQRRLWRAETAALDIAMIRNETSVAREFETVANDGKTALAFRSLALGSQELQLYSRIETRLHNQYIRALKTLKWLQDRRRRASQPVQSQPEPAKSPNEPKLVVVPAAEPGNGGADSRACRLETPLDAPVHPQNTPSPCKLRSNEALARQAYGVTPTASRYLTFAGADVYSPTADLDGIPRR